MLMVLEKSAWSFCAFVKRDDYHAFALKDSFQPFPPFHSLF